jgi:hypothetical protein
MSEYQYYEFQALDRPLEARELEKIRSFSTRAKITPTSFVNDYSWGDFRGDVGSWMENYFDAFLYFASWGTRSLAFRLPAKWIDPEFARQYARGESFTLSAKGDKVLLRFDSNAEDGDDGETEERLSDFIPLRSELAKGDHRALYLGWLLEVKSVDLDPDELEPPVPPGLGQLSGSLESFADFLRVDPDLLHVAAEASPPLRDPRFELEEIRTWVEALTGEEKDSVIAEAISRGDDAPIAALAGRFFASRAKLVSRSETKRRTIGELLRASESYGAEQDRMEAEKRAREKTRREREAEEARKAHLDGLIGREPQLWAEVELLVSSSKPKSYDAATKILVDLRDLAARGTNAGFEKRFAAFCEVHGRRHSLSKRLRAAGM